MLYSLSQLRDTDPPAPGTLYKLVHDFSSIVNNPEFPCIFSSSPFVRQEIFFGLVQEEDIESIVQLLKELCSRFRETPDAVGVLFVPQSEHVTLEDDLKLARNIVRSAMQQNVADGNAEGLPSPGDPDWRLWLDHTELFINFSSPRHRRRRSRNVGPCFTLVVQARSSFDHPSFKSSRARGEIRRRLESYDKVGPHPSLGDHHDPDNHDALHFFLGDDDQPLNVSGGGSDR
ncbi:YqcI/YcgG family protein [Streptomyces sp. NPDC091972]|uniref:YqcI/YcgG family protein n=1 Tax=Streptomyces sp. NPDC091972 TaxID=3366007 RepID=UPI0038004346